MKMLKSALGWIGILLLFGLMSPVMDMAGDWIRGPEPKTQCVDGVAYLVFHTGATVAYTPDGKVVTCGGTSFILQNPLPKF